MSRFKISDLPENTRMMHETQRGWRNKNWRDSLRNHSNDLEDLLSLIALFDYWATRLPSNDATSTRRRKSCASLDGQGPAGVGPLECFGHCTIEVINELENPLAQVVK